MSRQLALVRNFVEIDFGRLGAGTSSRMGKVQDRCFAAPELSATSA